MKYYYLLIFILLSSFVYADNTIFYSDFNGGTLDSNIWFDIKSAGVSIGTNNLTIVGDGSGENNGIQSKLNWSYASKGQVVLKLNITDTNFVDSSIPDSAYGMSFGMGDYNENKYPWFIHNQGGANLQNRYSATGLRLTNNLTNNTWYEYRQVLGNGWLASFTKNGTVLTNLTNITVLTTDQWNITITNWHTGGNVSVDYVIVCQDTNNDFDCDFINYFSIFNYNVSSSIGNGSIWNFNKNISVNTTDSTPTITFNTSHVANCSIGKNDLNYTDMIYADSNTKCQTVNTTYFTCTLPSTQKLSHFNNNIFVSCIMFNSAEANLTPLYTSTSTALNISLINDAINVTRLFLNRTEVLVNLSYVINFTDVQNDIINKSFIKWYKNGIEQTAFENATQIGFGNLTYRDNWTINISVFDGEIFSNWTYNTSIINDTTSPILVASSVSSLTALTTDSIIFYSNFTEYNATAAACNFELYKSDLGTPLFNITTDTRSVYNNYSYLESKTLSMVAIGTGTLEWKQIFCTDFAGNSIINTSVNINMTISSPSSGTPPSGGGGGGSPPTTGACVLQLYKPNPGQTISMYSGTAGKQTTPYSFIVKNTGDAASTFYFTIDDNAFLKENCEFEFDSAEIQPNLDFINTITCVVNENSETGTISINGCGSTGSYKLIVSTNKWLEVFTALLQGGYVTFFGYTFHSAFLWIGFFVSLFLLTGLLFLFKFLFGIPSFIGKWFK